MLDQPLKGVRVCDFTRVFAGSHTSLWLAVLGAEVIKVESVLRSDSLRAMPARSRLPEGMGNLNLSPTFIALNYSKKSITINLSSPQGKDLAKELVRISDAVTENFSPGVMERQGLGYEVLKGINPAIIMVSTSGLGNTGPDRGYLAYGPAIHSYSGLSAVTGYEGGHPESLPGGYSDLVAAQMATFSLLCALHHREKTGRGQHVDQAMAEAMLSLMPGPTVEYSMAERVVQRKANLEEGCAPHNVYPCKGDDKWVAIAVRTEEEWAALCRATGHSEWHSDPRFADGFERWRYRQELDELISQWTCQHTHREAMQLLQKTGVPAAGSFSVEEVAEDPHFRARDFFVELDHKELGHGRMARVTWRVNGEPGGVYTPAPLIGEHNDQVFRELMGLSSAEIERLVELKAIA